MSLIGGFIVKKIISILVSILVVIGIFFGYYEYQKKSLENDVIEYLNKEKGISENNIKSVSAFKSELPGDRGILVSVKIKDDKRTYFYYKNDKGKIVLESYTENGKEYVQ